MSNIFTSDDNEVQSTVASKNPFPKTQDTELPWEEEEEVAPKATKPSKPTKPSDALRNTKLPSENIQMGNNTNKPFGNRPPRTAASRSRTANTQQEEASYWLNVGIKYKVGDTGYFASPVGLGIPVTPRIKMSNTSTSNANINTSNGVANKLLEKLEALMENMKDGEVKYLPVTLEIRKTKTKVESSDLDEGIILDSLDEITDIG